MLRQYLFISTGFTQFQCVKINVLKKPIRILFVCLGNICRSPIAESVMIQLVQKSRLEDEIFVDSAGTSSYHQGELADPRARACLNKNGFPAPSKARQITAEDFEEFDMIVTMDENNYSDVQRIAHEHQAKVSKLLDWSKDFKGQIVPDPYYGQDSGFDEVLNLCIAGCHGILEHLNSNAKSELNQ